MLCPEVSNFPSPKIIVSHKTNQNIDSLNEAIKRNKFYKSLIITCPDEMNIPKSIEDFITEDTDTYMLSSCPLTEFIDNVFIDNFVKNGNLYCLSANKNCIVNNCAAITPDGMLTLHILDYVYQTLGLEGTKRPHNYYEVTIDLKYLKNIDKTKHCLQKLGTFDFHMFWEPSSDDICPSSVAKYFHNKNINISVCSFKMKSIYPKISQIPSVKGVEIDEIVEWIGMLCHEADLTPDEPYISTYVEPESAEPIESTRISLLIVKGFLTPTVISKVCQKLEEHVLSRLTSNYWAAVSIQSEDSLWSWNYSTPHMFQSYKSSDNIFLTKEGHITYSIGQLKYS